MTTSEVFTKAQFWEEHAKADADGRKRLHHRYHIQFATTATRQLVERRIGRDRIMASTDPYFNDIPLKEWDNLEQQVKHTIKQSKLTEAQPGGKPRTFLWSLSEAVCIAKEVAREMRNGEMDRAFMGDVTTEGNDEQK